MRNRRVRTAAVAAAAGLGFLTLGGCHVELSDSGPKFVCDTNDYVVVNGPLDVYYQPVNATVGLFCPGYYPGGQA